MQKLARDYLNELNRRHKKNRRALVAWILMAVLVVGGVLGTLAQYGFAEEETTAAVETTAAPEIQEETPTPAETTTAPEIQEETTTAAPENPEETTEGSGEGLEETTEAPEESSEEASMAETEESSEEASMAETEESSEEASTAETEESSEEASTAETEETETETEEVLYPEFDELYTDKERGMEIHIYAEEGVIPEGARLSVKPVVKKDTKELDQLAEEEKKEAEDTNAKFDEVRKELEATVAKDDKKEILHFVAYDISFLMEDETGELTEIEPNGEVKVTMNFVKAYLPEEATADKTAQINGVDIVHMKETDKGLEAEVVKDAEVSATKKVEVEKVEFTADSFSTYAIAWVGELGVFTYEDDQVIIQVTEAEEGAIPENSRLSVLPILQEGDTEEQYQSVAEKLLEKADGEEYDIAGFLAYDISFVDNEGNEVEPEGEVNVTMDYKEAAVPAEVQAMVEAEASGNEKAAEPDTVLNQMKAAKEAESGGTETAAEPGTLVLTLKDGNDQNADAEELSEDEDSQVEEADVQVEKAEVIEEGGPSVTVMHLEENEEGEVIRVVDMAKEEKITTLNVNENQEVGKVEFKTDKFSSFVIKWSNYSSSVSQTISIKDMDGTELNASIGNKSMGSSKFLISNIASDGTGVYQDLYKISAGGNEYVFFKAVEETSGEKVDSLTRDGWYSADDTKTSRNYKNTSFAFIYSKVTPHETVQTVDHSKDGIVMRMIDHSGYEKIWDKTLPKGYDFGTELLPTVKAAGSGNGANGLITSDDQSLAGMESTLVNGYPQWNGQSLESLFSGGDTVNQLFIESNGCYEYDSKNNYAYLTDETNEKGEKLFKVYKDVGTPADNSGEAYKQGNFFPYNDLSDRLSTQINNATNRNDLYLVELKDKKPNYFFGMYMEATFSQPENGKVNGDNMIYDFAGDDDLWLYIDDVLVLDLGGLHYMYRGNIDFATGKVEGWNDKNEQIIDTTIKALYQNAKKFPDGTDWDNNKVDEYFTETGTFINYSVHTLKMFYLERGAGASNLHMRMNIQSVPKDSVSVTKQLKDSDPKYANVEFPFQLYTQMEDPQRPGKYLDQYQLVTTVENVSDTIKVEATINADADNNGEPDAFVIPADGTFKLKPGQTVTLAGFPKNRKYYVKELNVDLERYANIEVNKIAYIGFTPDASGKSPFEEDETERTGEGNKGTLTLATSKQTVAARGSVTFTNDCSEANKQPLYVEKVMSDGTEDVGPFEVKIWMEGNTDGKLYPYSGDYYLIKTDKNNTKSYYQYDENGNIVGAEYGTKCGTTNDGIVKIPSGYKVETEKVIAGTAFAVEELNLDSKLYELQGIDKLVGDDPDHSADLDNIKALGCTALGNGAMVRITNKPVIQYTWQIVKKSSTNGTPGHELGSAEFTLTSVPTDGSEPITYTGVSQEVTGLIQWSQLIIPEEGGEPISVVVSASDIPKGTYTLQETAAPTGYALNGETWTITLGNDGITVTKPSAEPGGAPVTIEQTSYSETDKLYTYTFLNESLYELPSTGGRGIYRYMISGMLLMMAGALILYNNKRVRGC